MANQTLLEKAKAMNYKIVETGGELPDVLVFRDKVDDDEIVKILAIGKFDDVEDFLCVEEIVLPSDLTAKIFVRLFDKEAAESWCKDQGVSY